MIDLVRHGISGSTAVKIAGALEDRVRAGSLPPGERLPPVRDAARTLRVSPGTIASAYRLLRSRGVIITSGRRGTSVSHRAATPEYLPAPLPRSVRDLESAEPDPALLPDLGAALRRLPTAPGMYTGPREDPELLAWARSDFDHSGIPSAHLTVSHGAMAAIERALRITTRPGDIVAAEDPGYNLHFDAAASLGLSLTPLALDHDGVRPDALAAALRRGARAVILSARCQNPTGAALTQHRANELRAVLRRDPGVTVVIDDHAAMVAFPAYHHPIAPTGHRWIVARSWHKALAPDLRVGLVAGDEHTIRAMKRSQAISEGWVSSINQKILATLVRDRSVVAGVGRARHAYEQRRTALLTQLRAVGIAGAGKSGFNVWLPAPDEAGAVQSLRAEGYAVRAGARYRLASPPAIRATTARLDPRLAPRLASLFASALRHGSSHAAP